MKIETDRKLTFWKNILFLLFLEHWLFKDRKRPFSVLKLENILCLIWPTLCTKKINIIEKQHKSHYWFLNNFINGSIKCIVKLSFKSHSLVRGLTFVFTWNTGPVFHLYYSSFKWRQTGMMKYLTWMLLKWIITSEW